MSSSRKRKRRRLLELQEAKPAVVGPAHHDEPVADQPVGKSRIRVMAYGPEKLEEHEIVQPEDIRQFIGKLPVLWVHVDGLGDREAIAKVADIFLLHELAMEDVINVQQRPKVEQYGDQLYVVLRSVRFMSDAPVSEQISLFLGQGFVVSFEEKIGHEMLNAVRERVCKPGSHLRAEQADYLLYAIVDTIIDGYFPVVEGVGDALEDLEDEIVDHTDRYTPARIHELKRAVHSVRRAIWPSRDVVSILMREDTSDTLLAPKTRVYLRDCYDHAMRLIDLIETQRDICSDLMDLYLSSVSNRMNEIMKTLTIVTLLFMPPTLVAGIYGMNFQIPEYKWPHGYVYAIVIMGTSALLVGIWA
jgi:magnesium transporter